MKVGSGFVRYHYSRTKEWKRKVSIAKKGKKFSKGHKERISNALKGNKNCLGHQHSEESKRKMSESQKGHAVSKETKLKMSEAAKSRPSSFKGQRHTEESKRKMSEAHKGHIVSEEQKIKLRKSSTGRRHTEESKKKMSLIQKGRTVSEKHRKKLSESHKGNKPSEETKAKMSRAHKKLWADPVFHKAKQRKMSRGNNIRPNKPEKELLDLLQTLYPDDWKYVGGGDLIIGGKNPDFANVNGKKLLIELFGEHWHKDNSVRKRMGVFKPYGFRTLVIWQKELQNQNTLVNKINRFVNR